MRRRQEKGARITRKRGRAAREKEEQELGGMEGSIKEWEEEGEEEENGGRRRMGGRRTRIKGEGELGEVEGIKMDCEGEGGGEGKEKAEVEERQKEEEKIMEKEKDDGKQ